MSILIATALGLVVLMVQFAIAWTKASKKR